MSNVDPMANQYLEQLETEAYASWELGDLQQAADLFLAAEQVERDEASKRNAYAAADRSFLYRARAAFCLWDDGQYERARPLLLEVANFDWKAGRLWGDRYDYEKAFSRLLVEAASVGDRTSFTELWVAAVARGDALALPFPRILTEQRKLLQAALTLADRNVCRHILKNLNPKLVAKHHEMQLIQGQAEAFCREV
jgi:tetratricopeptide (TPR) repeat protein